MFNVFKKITKELVGTANTLHGARQIASNLHNTNFYPGIEGHAMPGGMYYVKIVK